LPPASAPLRPIPASLTAVADPGPFWNEPTRDFRATEQRQRFATALSKFAGAKPGSFGPVIDGTLVRGAGGQAAVNDPADVRRNLGSGTWADAAQTDEAVAVATSAAPKWAATSLSHRAELLFKLASRIRAERDALSALLINEVGKPWRDADAEVCEAIDFCEYYARQALSTLGPQVLQAEIPGEINTLQYIGRGVAGVIAPWNFPLAILCGMAAAALVTGNTVVVKPAEQSPLVAARFIQLAHAAGIPGAVLQLLPGLGEVVGARLVRHPDVLTVAFTGSRAVGLDIMAAAGQHRPGQRGFKRVICELGGKNPLVIDDDADLDEAVLGVTRSAFGFAGQKCSACSRVIVVDRRHDEFLKRLLEATAALRVGPASDPRTDVGPVIDAESVQRLSEAIARGRKEARLVAGGEVYGPGHFVQPTVFADVDPHGVLAREELFGPVLSVFRAPDFEAALALANDTDYALTAGLYSRSPAHIERASAVLRAGNVYLNRPITGAIVGRHPFGGYGMSGGGTKAGGPDYLRSFTDPRARCENTQRRGFAPD
jgi:RHH-type proline utilization regulon transcriptional repressor/proline dehydrogenase/delta 1-pyrroline-5-carboxylate dehydrogenase